MRPTALVASLFTIVLSVTALLACDNAAACKSDKDCQRTGRCSANEKGVANAVRVAARMVREDLTRKISEDLANVASRRTSVAAK